MVTGAFIVKAILCGLAGLLIMAMVAIKIWEDKTG